MRQYHNKDVFKQIFAEHWCKFRDMKAEYQTEYYEGIIKKMLRCGEPENGFISYRCTHCGEVKRIGFSCKSSFCLSCAKIYTDKWVEYIGRALFKGMRYRHVVLTMPEQFRGWFYHNPELMSELMKTGHKFFEDVVSYWLKDKVEVASAVVLQTAGRSGSYNPHLHIICSSGGMRRDGRWREFGYIDYDLLHGKWQYHFLEMMRENIKSGEVEEEIDRCWREYPKGFVAYIEKGDVPDGGRGLAYYLAKYVVSPPISVKRIIRYDGEMVRYWYRDHQTGKRVEEEVDAITFIGRMVQHILPKGFQRIRYYGLQATCRASKVREVFEESMKIGDKAVRGTYRVTGYRNRIKKSFGTDPLVCKRCGEEMEFEGIWHPEYGWIVNNFDNFFEDYIEGDGGEDGGAVQLSEPEVQIQMSVV